MRIARRLGSSLLLVLVLCGFRAVTGSYTGDGTASQTITTAVSFPVHLVWLKNTTDGDFPMIATAAMVLDEVTQATRLGGAEAWVTDCITSLGTGTFQVGTNARCNRAGTTHYYLALGQTAANDLALGTYSGNGVDDRNIVITPAFQPSFVLVAGNHSTVGGRIWTTASVPATTACVFDTASSCSALTNNLQALNPDGFQVGTGGRTNTNTTTYAYVAIKSGALGLAHGTYAGDGLDNREIAVGWEPTFVLTKTNETTNARFRFGSMVGDASFLFDDPPTTNGIQALSSTGFQVGTSSSANAAGQSFYWFAFRDDIPVNTLRRPWIGFMQ